MSGPDPVALPFRGASDDGGLAAAVPLVLFLYAIVVCSGILWDRRRQGLHDKAAHTLVVRAERETSKGEAVPPTG